MLTFVFLAMELCWVSLGLGLAWIGWGSGAWPLPLVVLAPAPLGVAAVRLSPTRWGRRRWYDLYRWGLAIVCGGLCARLATFVEGGEALGPRWNVAFVAGLVLFWRGWFVGEDELEPHAVEVAFQVGAVAVLVFVSALQWNVAGSASGLAPSVGFFLFGLLAIGLARRSERRVQGAGPETDWLALTVVLGLGTLVMAVGLVSLVSPALLQALAAQALWLARLVLGVLAVLLSWLARPPGVPEEPVAPLRPVTAVERLEFLLDLPPPLLWVLERVADTVLLLLLGYSMYRLVQFGIRRLRGRGTVEPEGQAPRCEALPFSWRQWWKLFLARVLGWFRRGGVRGAERPVSRDELQSSAEQRSVRGLYREFLQACARFGLPRAAHQTPHEFAAHLVARRPEVRPPLGDLTQVYVRARYARERIDRGQVARMRAAVEDATAQLRQPRAETNGRACEERPA